MTFDKRAWMIFGIVVGLMALVIALWVLFNTPTSVEVKSDFGKVERSEPES
jgi:hypothetical protein